MGHRLEVVYGLLAAQVTKSTDDGTLGSLSYALTHSPPNQIISLSPVTTTTISITGALPGVPKSVTLKSSCVGGPGVTLQYSSGPATDGLTLLFGDWIYGVEVRGFPGVQVKAPGGGGNALNCVIASKT